MRRGYIGRGDDSRGRGRRETGVRGIRTPTLRREETEEREPRSH